MNIKIKDIPQFLHVSEFYNNLDRENPEDIISIKKLKLNDEVKNIEDFKNIIKTINFFITDKYPQTLIEYFEENSMEIDLKDIPREFINLEIKNHRQFFTIYKLINFYKLNDIEQKNYINYAIQNTNDILGYSDNYLIDDPEFEDLVDKICSTVIFEFISVENHENIHLVKCKIKKLSNDWENITIRFFTNDFLNLLKKLKYEIEINGFYQDINQRDLINEIMKLIKYPSYNNKNLSFEAIELSKTSIFSYSIDIKINNFNKLYILNSFQELILILENNTDL